MKKYLLLLLTMLTTSLGAWAGTTVNLKDDSGNALTSTVEYDTGEYSKAAKFALANASDFVSWFNGSNYSTLGFSLEDIPSNSISFKVTDSNLFSDGKAAFATLSMGTGSITLYDCDSWNFS